MTAIRTYLRVGSLSSRNYFIFARILPCLILLSSVRPGLNIRALALGPKYESYVVSNQKEPNELKLGDSIERELAGGEHHVYRLGLPAGRYLRVVVQQLGIDVELTISQFDGVELTKTDRPNGSRGRETASVITPSDGSYLLEIRSLESVSAQGRYQLHIETLREPAGADREWIAAEQVVFKAEELRSKSTAEAFHQAILEFDRAADMWKTLNQPYEQAVAFYGSGMSCTSLGENQKALIYLFRAASLFEGDIHGQAITMAALGWPHMYLGDNDKAEQYFAEALRLYQLERNIRGEGVALYGLGWVEALREHNDLALNKFSDSLARRREAKDRRGEAVTLTGIGKVQARMGRHTRALDSLKQALTVADRDLYLQADILSNLGWLHNGLSDEREALDYFSRALPLRRQVGDRIGEATTLYGISKAQRRLSNHQESLSAIESAVDILEPVRTQGLSQQLRISYFASIQDYYDSYIEILMFLHKLHPAAGYAARALHACERARARGLIDLLPEAKIDLRAGVDSSLLELEQSINEKLNAAAVRRHKLLNEKYTPEEARRSTLEITDLAKQDDAIKARIREANPRFAAITRPQPLTTAEIQQQLLDKDTLLLEYFLGENRSYLWAVGPNEFASYELPPRREVEDVARQVYEQLTSRNRLVDNETSEARSLRVSGADVKATEALLRLSKILLSQVAERLGTRKLVIVVQGALQYIPFAALPKTLVIAQRQVNKEISSSTSDSRPLLVDHEIVVLPSATTLAVLRDETANRKPATREVAAFADPVYSATDARVQEEASSSQASLEYDKGPPRSSDAGNRIETEFPRLIGSMWEATKIVGLVPTNQGKLFLDFAANRANAVSAETGKYRFLHFAAHALIDNEHPELSGIALSTVDRNGHPKDGFLRSNDIFNLRLSADLVVLSACRTALGREFKGEGLMGLSRGFMYAGAPRVVASLWEIEDKATSELMVRFYRRMLGPEKLSPAAGLRMAQLDLRKDPRWHAPYYWAGFTLQGEWR
ncbi:MAG: CHAT domain-containing protein [Pyrinomonadaceae bacterium]